MRRYFLQVIWSLHCLLLRNDITKEKKKWYISEMQSIYHVKQVWTLSIFSRKGEPDMKASWKCSQVKFTQDMKNISAFWEGFIWNMEVLVVLVKDMKKKTMEMVWVYCEKRPTLILPQRTKKWGARVCGNVAGTLNKFTVPPFARVVGVCVGRKNPG